MAKLETVEDDGHHDHHTSSEFSKKTGIMYCLGCGKECLSEDGICIQCGKNNFLNTNSSGFIGGYIELAKKNKLKTYYKNRYSKSIIKMNEKRIIHQLLLHKDKIDIKKETIDRIYNINV